VLGRAGLLSMLMFSIQLAAASAVPFVYCSLSIQLVSACLPEFVHVSAKQFLC
jgi:hypothetical protein